jgi:hypothetical protein
VDLLNFTMSDGSRQFIALPESLEFHELSDYLKGLPGFEVTEFLTDGVVEVVSIIAVKTIQLPDPNHYTRGAPFCRNCRVVLGSYSKVSEG